MNLDSIEERYEGTLSLILRLSACNDYNLFRYGRDGLSHFITADAIIDNIDYYLSQTVTWHITLTLDCYERIMIGLEHYMIDGVFYYLTNSGLSQIVFHLT